MEADYGKIRDGQPIYKSRFKEYLESLVESDPFFEDHEGNSELHLAIIRDDARTFHINVKDPKFISHLLNSRNSEGKSPLYLAIEHGREEMFDCLFDHFRDHIDFYSKDTLNGYTVLHMACLKENDKAARLIYEYEPELCMVPNWKGQSPFFIAC